MKRQKAKPGYWEVGIWIDGGKARGQRFWDWFAWIPTRLAGTPEIAIDIAKRYSMRDGRFTARKRLCGSATWKRAA